MKDLYTLVPAALEAAADAEDVSYCWTTEKRSCRRFDNIFFHKKTFFSGKKSSPLFERLTVLSFARSSVRRTPSKHSLTTFNARSLSCVSLKFVLVILFAVVSPLTLLVSAILTIVKNFMLQGRATCFLYCKYVVWTTLLSFLKLVSLRGFFVADAPLVA